MSIQITIQAVTAAEVSQLVHDLADTMVANPDIPANTVVSTIQPPAYQQSTPQTPPVPPVYPPQPVAPAPNVVPFPPQQQQLPLPPTPVPTYPAQQPPVQQAGPDPASAVPVAAQTFTMDQLAVAATSLIDAGRITEVQTLLGQFGVQALTALPKEHYGLFATHLRSLGARI